MNIQTKRDVPRRAAPCQFIEERAARTASAGLGTNGDAHFRYGGTFCVEHEWRVAVEGPCSRDWAAQYIGGNEDRVVIGRQEVVDVLGIPVREWPILDDTGVPRHLDDEPTIVHGG